MIKNIERTKNGMDALIDRTRDAVVGITDRTERGVEATAEQIVAKAHVAGEHIRGGAETASDGAHRSVQSAANAIDQGYTRARGDLSRATAAVGDYSMENPGKALLLAAGAGFVLGLLARRRSGRTRGERNPT